MEFAGKDEESFVCFRVWMLCSEWKTPLWLGLYFHDAKLSSFMILPVVACYIQVVGHSTSTPIREIEYIFFYLSSLSMPYEAVESVTGPALFCHWMRANTLQINFFVLFWW